MPGTRGASRLATFGAWVAARLRGKFVGGGLLMLGLVVAALVYEWRRYATARAMAAEKRAVRERQDAAGQADLTASAARVRAASERATEAWLAAQQAHDTREELRERLQARTGLPSAAEIMRRADVLGLR